jgi:PhnB protein
MSINKGSTFFAPELFIKSGTNDISFYEKAFGAIEHFRFNNDDGNLHVAELSIDGAIFHIHEESTTKPFFPPQKYNGNTVCIGLFVSDVHEVMNRAIAAGAVEIDPTTDHDYGYRQGMIKDPFGFYWQVQKKI